MADLTPRQDSPLSGKPPPNFKLVIVESPYKGDVARNTRYLRSCLRDCISRGESPYASHRMLTDCLDDGDPNERRLGIEAGLAWRNVVTLDGFRVKHVFYTDLGWTDGMKLARELYLSESIVFEERTLSPVDVFWKDPAHDVRRVFGENTRKFLRRLAFDHAADVASDDEYRALCRQVVKELGE